MVASLLAHGCALLAMVARLTKDDPAMSAVVQQLDTARAQALMYGDADARGFRGVMKAWRTGGETLQRALKEAIAAPAQTLALCTELASTADALAARGNANLVSDVIIAADLLGSAGRGALVNIEVNAIGLTDVAERERILAAANTELAELELALTASRRAARTRMHSA